MGREAPQRLLRVVPAAGQVPGRGVHGVALAGGVGVGDVSVVAPAGRGRVQRRVRRGVAGRLRRGEADGGRLLVEGQRAVAVLPGEDGRGAAVARLVGRLALDGHVGLAPARVVGLQEGAVHETFVDCGIRKQETKLIKCIAVWSYIQKFRLKR